MPQMRITKIFAIVTLCMLFPNRFVDNMQANRITFNTPTESGLPEQFTTINTRGVLNDDLDQYTPNNEHMDVYGGFMSALSGEMHEEKELDQKTEGSSSLKIYCQNFGETQQENNIYQSFISPRPNIRYNATLKFDWFLESMPVLLDEQDYFLIRLELNNSQTIYIMIGGWNPYYYTNNVAVNVTNNNQKSAWYSANINLTQSYIDSEGPIIEDTGISYVYIYKIGRASCRERV